jgi:putative hydrolase of the HAD superfamily
MIDWEKIETVFFDMDGTLLDLHFDNYFWLEHLPKRLTELKSLTHDQAVKTLHDMYEAHQGSLNWYCLDFWSDALQIDIVELKREVSSKIAYRPHVKAFLSQLHTLDVEIAIVTNAHRDSIALKLEQTDLGQYFDEIICSHDFNMAKEAPEFWQALNLSRPFNREKTAFFDDNEAVLESAQTFGIQYLFSITQPDSQKALRHEDQFPMVQNFLDLLPPKNEIKT